VRRTIYMLTSLSILLAAILACNTPGASTPTAEVAPTATSMIYIPPTEAATTAATAEPTALLPTFVFGGISMWLPESFGLVPAVHKPADPTQDANPYWILPERDEIYFDHYPLSNQQQLAQMMVIPVSGFPGYNDSAAEEVARLQQFLAQEQDPASIPASETIPQLSVLNAPQVFHSNVKYLDFQNGSGVRFMTMFAHDVSPITNASLYYCFQGLTSDGQYLVTAMLPIGHFMLPADGTMEPGAYEALSADYENYLKTTVDALNNADPAGWSPSPEYLDQIFQSVKIEGPGE